MPKLFQHENLTIFKQHGFVPVGELSDGKHVHGNCIFCGSYSQKLKTFKNSFYVNVDIKAWDCKICSLEGGYQTFLNELYKFGIQNFTEERVKVLSENRQIPKKILRSHGVGYNPVIDKYYVPVFNLSHQIIDLKIFDIKAKEKFRYVSSSGAKKSLYFGKNVPDLQKKIYYLVEGEWDRMVFKSVIDELKIKAEVFGLPGALSMCMGWIDYFREKDVIVILDNDFDREVNGRLIEGAGKKGCKKIYGLLNGNCKSIKFLHWEESGKLGNGYDIRDLYIDNKKDSKKIIEFINKHLYDYPQGFEEKELEIIRKENSKLPIIYAGKGCTIGKVYEVFNKYLKMENNDLIDIVTSTIIANRMPGSPVWLFLVGASGSGKSEVSMSLSGLSFVESISSLSNHVLISGMNYRNHHDPSLIPKLNGRVLNIKDFTTIIGMDKTSQSGIVTTLRDAFDGHCAKPFGNGRMVRYESKFGIIAGVTQVIDHFSENLSSLGERFIRYEIKIEKSIAGEQAVLLKVMNNLFGEIKEKMKLELKEIMSEFLNYPFVLTFFPEEEARIKVATIAQLTGLLRGSVLRDGRTGDIIYKPMIESPTRLTEQFLKLFIALHVIHGENTTNLKYLDILRDVSLSTMSANYRDIINVIINEEKDISFEDIQKKIGLPSPTVRKNMDNLVILGALDKIQLDKVNNFGARYKYKLSNRLRILNQKSGVFTK